MRVVATLSEVAVDSFGDVSFGLYLSNKGSSAYACLALRATIIPTRGATRRVLPQNPERCTGSGHTIASGSKVWLRFYVPGNSHAPKDIVLLPYGSTVGRIVWSVAGCPADATPCFTSQSSTTGHFVVPSSQKTAAGYVTNTHWQRR